jgi:hypothetical protein
MADIRRLFRVALESGDVAVMCASWDDPDNRGNGLRRPRRVASAQRSCTRLVEPCLTASAFRGNSYLMRSPHGESVQIRITFARRRSPKFKEPFMPSDKLYA